MTAAEFTYTVLLKPYPLRVTANAILKAIIPRTARRCGAVLALNPNDPVVSGALTLNVYEKPETAFFLKICRPGLTFLDIGANLGYYTALALSRMKGRGRIIALEPDPINLGFLEKTISLNPFPEIVSRFQMAASDHEGRMNLYVSTDNRGDNRMYENEFSRGSVEVDVTTVDRLISQLGDPVVDLVKIDVQGYEYAVAMGMRKTIASAPNMCLLSEFWPYGLASAGASGELYLQLLADLGFQLFELGAPLKPIHDFPDLVRRYQKRAYTDIVGVRGALKNWGLDAG